MGKARGGRDFQRSDAGAVQDEGQSFARHSRVESENLECELNGLRVDRDNADVLSEEFMNNVVSIQPELKIVASAANHRQCRGRTK